MVNRNDLNILHFFVVFFYLKKNTFCLLLQKKANPPGKIDFFFIFVIEEKIVRLCFDFLSKKIGNLIILRVFLFFFFYYFYRFCLSSLIKSIFKQNKYSKKKQAKKPIMQHN